jgi:hypothetical protein
LLIAHLDFSYLVVLGVRKKGYYHLITAYTIEHERQQRNLKADYGSPQKS